MTPSTSGLERLSTLLSEGWEINRESFGQALRQGPQIPEGAVSIAVSLDGVLAPAEGTHSAVDVGAQAAREGRLSKGPAGYRELGCATVS